MVSGIPSRETWTSSSSDVVDQTPRTGRHRRDEPVDRHLDDERVDVEPGQRVLRPVVAAGVADRGGLTAQRQQVEDLEIDEEGVVGLAGVRP